MPGKFDKNTTFFVTNNEDEKIENHQLSDEFLKCQQAILGMSASCVTFSSV
jgi:hypothetical protein